MNPLTRVSSLMSTELVTVTLGTPLAEAQKMLTIHKFHHLPVVDESYKLKGILSQSDFVRTHDITTGVVGDLMTKGLAKLETDDTIRTAANLFTLNKFHALPVVDAEGKLLGIITTLDLIKFLDSEPVELSDYTV